MSEPAIRVEGLSKRYRLGAAQQRNSYRTFRDSVGEFIKSPFKKAAPVEDFWALKDVSFEIQPGEVAAMIGRNGAGKSTLLKLLSRITKPTKGKIEINGRVSSLLEVGTGFHPELTGRENIYLNGSILGMRRYEIDRKFNEIVEFAEIDKFLDTPVKRYSSGMYVRLAFSVSAHLEPDILIVDEVLSVGDSSFQQKCLGKIGNVAKGGRTVVFVSHHLQTISTLCSKAFLLSKGTIVSSGAPRSVIQTYLETTVNESPEVSWNPEEAPGNEIARLQSIRIIDHQGRPTVDFDIANFIDVELRFWVFDRTSRIDASIHVLNNDSLCLFAVVGEVRNSEDGLTEPGLYRATCRIPANLLNDGRHYISAFLMRNSSDVFVQLQQVATFKMHDFGTSRGEYVGKMIGAIRPLLNWDIERVEGIT